MTHQMDDLQAVAMDIDNGIMDLENQDENPNGDSTNLENQETENKIEESTEMNNDDAGVEDDDILTDLTQAENDKIIKKMEKDKGRRMSRDEVSEAMQTLALHNMKKRKSYRKKNARKAKNAKKEIDMDGVSVGDDPKDEDKDGSDDDDDEEDGDDEKKRLGKLI